MIPEFSDGIGVTALQEEVAFLSRKILDLNARLMESEKAKGKFLSLIANELNNPMSAILGLAQYLAAGKGGDKSAAIGSMIYEEAGKIDFRLRNVVAAAEIESGIAITAWTVTEPSVLVGDACKALAYLLEPKTITVEWISQGCDLVVSDAGKLYLVILNLLANAAEHGDAGSTVRILGVKHETTWSLTVENRGDAPAVTHKPEVFVRFADQPGLHGMGLGLSVARALVEHMDGMLDYRAGESTVAFSALFALHDDVPDKADGGDTFLFETFADAIEL